MMLQHGHHQLDFLTPGRRPSKAILRKQIRQIPNFRIKARGRPQMGHRLYAWTANFGLRMAFVRIDFFANSILLSALIHKPC